MDNNFPEPRKKTFFYQAIFFLFLLSGFCGLLYQIVWLRLAFAAFGIITPVLSVLLSVYMFGLGIGSWLGGKYIGEIVKRTKISALVFYALVELIIGIGGLLVPELFSLGQKLLLNTGNFNSLSYLTFSALILGLSIFPWCVCMGATIPFMIYFIRQFDASDSKAFSYLYLANCLGAMCGVIITAGFLIEFLGFNRTLLVAVSTNFTIALVGLFLVSRYRQVKIYYESQVSGPAAGISYMTIALFSTGFISMALEVVWVRAFTPLLYTTVYSFASVLVIYLSAVWLGSWLYRIHASRDKVIGLISLMIMLTLFSFLPIIFSDPRVWRMPFMAWIYRGYLALSIFSIFPFCATLGYITPKIIDELSGGRPRAVGTLYALNVLGCILGPLFAGYIFLPLLGVKLSLLVLVFPFAIFSLYSLVNSTLSRFYAASVSFGIVLIIIMSWVISRSFEDAPYNNPKVVHRDYAATVISCGSGMNKRLLVNGIGMTELTPMTKFMAHIPLGIQRKRPESALIICFGMGTTLRSASTWGIKATAVELVPGVRDAFGYYFSDAREVLKRPGVNIIIDDGRRFLRRTKEKYDLITIDPPPPVESSGSGLLYSREFYRLAKSKLKSNGILAQWFPEGEEAILKGIAYSINKEFPYVKVFSLRENKYFYFFASMEPFQMPDPSDFASRLNPEAARDLLEWNKAEDVKGLYSGFLRSEIPMGKILAVSDSVGITDDQPLNEYFLVRRFLTKLK